MSSDIDGRLHHELLASLHARDDVTHIEDGPTAYDDAHLYEAFAIEADVPALGRLMAGSLPLSLDLSSLLLGTINQLRRRNIKPQDTRQTLWVGFTDTSVVSYFTCEGYPFCLYMSAVKGYDETNPGVATARIGLTVNVDRDLL